MQHGRPCFSESNSCPISSWYSYSVSCSSWIKIGRVYRWLSQPSRSQFRKAYPPLPHIIHFFLNSDRICPFSPQQKQWPGFKIYSQDSGSPHFRLSSSRYVIHRNAKSIINEFLQFFFCKSFSCSIFRCGINLEILRKCRHFVG